MSRSIYYPYHRQEKTVIVDNSDEPEAIQLTDPPTWDQIMLVIGAMNPGSGCTLQTFTWNVEEKIDMADPANGR